MVRLGGCAGDEFMVDSEVLKFGEFTLKSGRKSPFFMNAGGYVTGSQSPPKEANTFLLIPASAILVSVTISAPFFIRFLAISTAFSE